MLANDTGSAHFSGRLFVIFNGRFPSEQAHSLFVAKSAEAFSTIGCENIILSPDRNRTKVTSKEYFKLTIEPNIVYLKTIDFAKFKMLRVPAYYLGNIIFGIQVRTFLKKNASKSDIIYTNDSYVLPFLKSYYVCYELHDFPERYFGLYRFLFSFAKKILVTNIWKENKLHELFKGTVGKTFVELNAVDLEKFTVHKTKQELRIDLDLNQAEKIVLYTGHLYGWKGAEVLAEAARLLPEVSFYFLGGKPHDVNTFKKKYISVGNIHILGHQQHELIPGWQKAADVLVIPNSGKSKIARYYTSPMKLFEYMASGVPVVASDLPSIREIADETMVYFAESDNPLSFAQTISTVFGDTEQIKKVRRAYELVSKHTWRDRAQRILAQLRAPS